MCSSCCFFKQKTAYELRISDWSSDVCSSDLPAAYYNLPVETVERIEVIKGGASVLYGPNTVGGVVHYVTRRPPEQREIRVKEPIRQATKSVVSGKRVSLRVALGCRRPINYKYSTTTLTNLRP